MIPHVQAELAPAYAHVVAGKSAQITIRVHNSGSEIEELALGLQGRLSKWAEITPARLRLFPGEDAAARITFDLGARDSDIPQGPMPYAATVSSWVNDELATVVFGTLTVDASEAPLLELVPLTAAGRFAVTYQLTVYNSGSSKVEGHLLISNPGQGLRFESDAIPISVPAGSDERTLLRVKPRERLWWGAPLEHKFHIMLHSRDEDVLTAEGVLLQLPIMPTRRRF